MNNKFFIFITLVFLVMNAEANEVEVNGLRYDLDSVNLTASVVGYTNTYCLNGCSFTIPQSVVSSGQSYVVTSIGNGAFAWCYLDSIALPNSIISIGAGAFEHCVDLSSIILPNNLDTIKSNTFKDCVSLSSISLPNGLTTIFSAFLNCTSLTSLSLPNTVTYIEGGTFSTTGIATPVYNNRLFAYMPTAYQGSYSVPNGISEIVDCAFSGCAQLTSISLPNTITKIGGSAFSCCALLTSISLPNSITQVGGSAFNSCSSLISISLPNGINAISDRTFAGCSSLSTVSLPNNLKAIRDLAFYNCTKLSTITLPNGLDSIGWQAFSFCDSLKSINLPNSVTYLGLNVFWKSGINTPIYNNKIFAYMPRSYRGTYSIPYGITDIAYNAFEECQYLNSIVIPSTVDTVWSSAFSKCPGLSSVESENTVPPVCIGTTVFNSLPTTAKLYVPHGCNEAYATANGWSDFYPNIFCPYLINVYTEDYNKGFVSGDSLYESDSYAIICGWANHGYRFSHWNDGNKNNPRILKVTCDSSFTAYFMPDTFRVNARTSDPSMGNVTGSGKYAYNDVATITAIAVNGYEFKYWDNGETFSTLQLNVECDTIVTAVFSPAGQSDVDEVFENEVSIVVENYDIIIDAIRMSVEIYDTSGKMIMKEDKCAETVRINVLTAGIYFVRITNNLGNVRVEKVVVK